MEFRFSPQEEAFHAHLKAESVRPPSDRIDKSTDDPEGWCQPES